MRGNGEMCPASRLMVVFRAAITESERNASARGLAIWPQRPSAPPGPAARVA